MYTKLNFARGFARVNSEFHNQFGLYPTRGDIFIIITLLLFSQEQYFFQTSNESSPFVWGGRGSQTLTD